jgi:hypothetical protein
VSARVFVALALGVALAVVGTIATAGTSYTPPASSGGGVEGDGTGITDASAFRTELGLGTAAVLDTGTTANKVVKLDAMGKLPAVDGSALTNIGGGLPTGGVTSQVLQKASNFNYDTSWVTLGGAAYYEASSFEPADATLTELASLVWSSGTQIPAFLGTDTASLLTVGTGALGIVQLDGDGKLPAVDGSALTNVAASPYAADSWDTVWEGADGATGWTFSTNGGIGTVDGKTAARITGGSSSSEASYYNIAGSAPDGSFEVRWMAYVSDYYVTGDWQTAWKICAFGKRILPAFSASGMTLYKSTGASGVGYPNSAILLNEWVLITMRVTSPDTGNTAPDTLGVQAQIWLGEHLVYTGLVDPVNSASGSADQAAGMFSVDRYTSTGTTAVAWVAYRDGFNAAPPSYTYRGQGYAASVAAP